MSAKPDNDNSLSPWGYLVDFHEFLKGKNPEHAEKLEWWLKDAYWCAPEIFADAIARYGEKLAEVCPDPDADLVEAWKELTKRFQDFLAELNIQ